MNPASLARALGTPAASSSGFHTSPPRLAFTPTEAAAALGVSLDFLNEHVAHELRWVYRGRKRLVAVAELGRWLDEHAERLPR